MQRTSGQLATAAQIIERLIGRHQLSASEATRVTQSNSVILEQIPPEVTSVNPSAFATNNPNALARSELSLALSIDESTSDTGIAGLTATQVFNFRLNLLPKDPKNQPWHTQNNVLSMTAAMQFWHSAENQGRYQVHGGIILPEGKVTNLVSSDQVGLYNQVFNLLSEDKTALVEYESLPVAEFIERYKLTVDSDWLTTAEHKWEADVLDSRLAGSTVSELLGLSVTYQVTGDYMGQSTVLRAPIRHLMTSDDKASETKLREALNLSWHQKVLSHRIDTEAFGLNSGCMALKEHVLANIHNAELLQDCDTLFLEDFIQKRPLVRLDDLAPPESLLLRLAAEQRRDNDTRDKASPKLSLTQDIEDDAERIEAGRLEGLATPDNVEDAGFTKDKDKSVSQNSRFRF